jgi:predicted DNA-binding helix-hairpin-helix protein
VESQVAAVLQYGALGILAIIVFAGVLVMRKIAEAILSAIAKHGESTEKLALSIATQETKAIDRHHASNEKITDAIDRMTESLRAEIRDSAKETQHQARQHVQAVTNTVAIYAGRKQSGPFPVKP